MLTHSVTMQRNVAEHETLSPVSYNKTQGDRTYHSTGAYTLHQYGAVDHSTLYEVPSYLTVCHAMTRCIMWHAHLLLLVHDVLPKFIT